MYNHTLLITDKLTSHMKQYLNTVFIPDPMSS